MGDKTIIDITNLDAEKHAENSAKRVASYSEKLLHHASILSEKEYQKFLLERLETMPQLLITTAQQKRQSSFLPRCRTRCILQFTAIRLQS